MFDGGGTAPAGPGCLGTEASTLPHSPQTRTVRTLSNTPRPQLRYFFALGISVHLPRHANARQDERLHPVVAGMQCPGDDALLGSFDASLLARSGTSGQEQEDFITHFIDVGLYHRRCRKVPGSGFASITLQQVPARRRTTFA